MTTAEFHDHWKERHGPLVANSAAVRRYVVRYEQNHAGASNSNLPDLGFDGVSVMWFRSIDDFHALRADPEYRDVVVRDGETFCDASETRVMMTVDEEQFAIADSAEAQPR